MSCDRSWLSLWPDGAQLSSALKAEQIAHEETRQSLTTALGDTIDLLAKDQTSQSDESLDSAE